MIYFIILATMLKLTSVTNISSRLKRKKKLILQIKNQMPRALFSSTSFPISSFQLPTPTLPVSVTIKSDRVCIKYV